MDLNPNNSNKSKIKRKSPKSVLKKLIKNSLTRRAKEASISPRTKKPSIFQRSESLILTSNRKICRNFTSQIRPGIIFCYPATSRSRKKEPFVSLFLYFFLFFEKKRRALSPISPPILTALWLFGKFNKFAYQKYYKSSRSLYPITFIFTWSSVPRYFSSIYFFRVLCVLERSPRLCPLSNQFVGLSKVDAVINDRLAYVAYKIYKNLSSKINFRIQFIIFK